ncbi:MAG: DUF5683 domain-containing protein [Patescibacteria group bacterium]
MKNLEVEVAGKLLISAVDFRRLWTVIVVLLFVTAVVPRSLFSQSVQYTDSLEVAAEKTIISADTINVIKEHSPHKATLLALVPGLGQIYNKKYWKVPIVYAGFGVFAYLAAFNQNLYVDYRDAYYHSFVDDGSPPVNEYEEKYPQSFLLDSKNYYRRNRDLNYILMGVWYALSIVDATVDAHLMSWNVNDDLSLKVEPAVYSGLYNFKPGGGGVKLTLRFK